MDQFLDSQNLHHAYFLIGDKKNVFSILKKFLESELKVETAGNPDFWVGEFHNFAIDEAREVVTCAERKSFSGGKKIFIIQSDFITAEAQNSLLKAFEEPTLQTHFFIISPQDVLLPTLRSRVHVIPMSKTVFDIGGSVLKLKLADRLAKVKEITESISDEEKTKQDAITFLNKVEKELYDLGIERSAKSLETCQKARESLYDRGAPVKIILENLVLSL